MKKELDRSKGSFKLDLIETANADPVLSPADFKLLAAYVAVMAWPSCRTWLATPLALAMTGLSERQFRNSRLVLRGKNEAGRAYLTPAKQNGKVTAYRLGNPWRDGALTHVEAMTAYHREVARQKKAGQRATLSRQNLQGQEVDLSLQNLPGHKPGCPCKICRSVPAEFAAYSPSMITPRKKEVREKVSHGSNVVPIDIKRRSAS